MSGFYPINICVDHSVVNYRAPFCGSRSTVKTNARSPSCTSAISNVGFHGLAFIGCHTTRSRSMEACTARSYQDAMKESTVERIVDKRRRQSVTG